MTELERAREFFAGDLYATEATGIVIDEVGDGYAKVSLSLDSRHQNAVGHVMGGVMFTMADFAFAVATNRGENITVSTVAQISHLASPKGKVLYAESRLVKDGRRTCFYQVDVTDDTGTLIATVTFCGTKILKN